MRALISIKYWHFILLPKTLLTLRAVRNLYVLWKHLCWWITDVIYFQIHSRIGELNFFLIINWSRFILCLAFSQAAKLENLPLFLSLKKHQLLPQPEFPLSLLWGTISFVHSRTFHIKKYLALCPYTLLYTTVTDIKLQLIWFLGEYIKKFR